MKPKRPLDRWQRLVNRTLARALRYYNRQDLGVDLLVVPIVIYSLAIEIYRKFHICFMRHFFHFREINFISIPGSEAWSESAYGGGEAGFPTSERAVYALRASG